MNGRNSGQRGYLLTEMLVYISVVMVVIGVGYIAMYRSMNNSLGLRRSAEDIGRALNMGELWRADVRHAERIRVEGDGDEQIVLMESGVGTNSWRHAGNDAMRRAGVGPWVTVLPNAKNFTMRPDPRGDIAPWRLEMELVTRSKSARIRPLFTFTAVPAKSPLK